MRRFDHDVAGYSRIRNLDQVCHKGNSHFVISV